MLVYSCQSLPAYKSLQQKGFLRSKRPWLWPEFIPAYRWMRKELRLRGGKLGSADYPIWVWPEKPDIQSGGQVGPGQAAVLLTLDTPKRKVLFSNFHAWHMVLGNDFLSLTEREARQFEAGRKWDRAKVEASWKKIFDLEAVGKSSVWNCYRKGWQGKVDMKEVQGVVDRIRWQQVVGVRHFRG